jgi:hypothetical protein
LKGEIKMFEVTGRKIVTAVSIGGVKYISVERDGKRVWQREEEMAKEAYISDLTASGQDR